MRTPRRFDVLAIARDAATVSPLATFLKDLAVSIEIVHDVPDALRAFQDRGGHDALVLAPDVAPAIANEAMERLRSVDARLVVIVFGRNLLLHQKRVLRLGGHLPNTRAGAFALWRGLHVAAPR